LYLPSYAVPLGETSMEFYESLRQSGVHLFPAGEADRFEAKRRTTADTISPSQLQRPTEDPLGRHLLARHRTRQCSQPRGLSGRAASAPSSTTQRWIGARSARCQGCPHHLVNSKVTATTAFVTPEPLTNVVLAANKEAGGHRWPRQFPRPRPILTTKPILSGYLSLSLPAACLQAFSFFPLPSPRSATLDTRLSMIALALSEETHLFSPRLFTRHNILVKCEHVFFFS